MNTLVIFLSTHFISSPGLLSIEVIALNSMWETDELPENFHKLYGNEDGTMKKVGDLIYNTALCETLTAIRDEGASALYEGKIAQSIVDTVDNEQGLSLEDLKDYFVRVTDPLQVKFNGTVS